MENTLQTSSPFTLSEDPEERKKMRRERIKLRLEQAERRKTGKYNEVDEPELEQTFIDYTIELSRDALRRLYLEGREQVSNIMIARDKMEMERRKEEAEERELRINKLRKESAEAQEKLDLISKKWEELLETRDPLELFQYMSEQKERCLDLIEQKNEVIKDFQEDLKMADEKYMKNKKEMHRELALLTRRIDEQTLVMKKAYRGELEKVEVSIKNTLSEEAQNRTKNWERLYNQREKFEVFNVEKDIKMAQDLQENVRQIHMDHDERQRETRIQLEGDIQVLELELQQIKALCLLNSEKLDYNYQILKKREEENVYIKNHQKRRLNKLQDILNNTKKKFESQKTTSAQLHDLLKDIARCHTCVLDTERKADYFSKLNDEKFNQLWDMKEEEAKDIVGKIRIADKIIYEQIMGKSWKPPNTPNINKMDMPSYKAATLFAVPGPKVIDSDSAMKVTKDFSEDDRSHEVLEGHHRLLHHILELISDQAGFLLDHKLKILLEPHTEMEKNFVRLESVFSAIGINKEKDIEMLKKAFYPYVFCQVCDKKDDGTAKDVKLESGPHKRKASSVLLFEERARDTQEKEPKTTIKYDLEDTDEDTASESSEDRALSESFTEKVAEPQNLPSLKSVKSKETEVQVGRCNITHPLIIEKHNVLKGLKDFVINFHSDRCRLTTGIESKIGQKRFTVSRLLTKDDIAMYWEKYLNLLPAKIEIVWNMVFLALTKYFKLLRDRHDINVKAQELRKQNHELRRLLSLHRIKKIHHLPGIASTPENPIDLEEISKITNKLAL